MLRRTFLQAGAGSLCTAMATAGAARSENRVFELGYWRGSEQLPNLSRLEWAEEGFLVPGGEQCSSLANQPIVAPESLWPGGAPLSGIPLTLTLWPVNFETSRHRRLAIQCHFPCRDRERKVLIWQHSTDRARNTGSPVRFSFPCQNCLRMTVESGSAADAASQLVELKSDAFWGGKLRPGVYVLMATPPGYARFQIESGREGVLFRLTDRLGRPSTRPYLLLAVEG